MCALLSAVLCVVGALQQPQCAGAQARAQAARAARAPPHCGRRAITVTAASVALAPHRALASTKDTIFGEGNDERCENGEGAACARLAEGNELVAKLQARSRENKEKNAQAIVDKTVMQLGYSDFFDALDKNLVKMPDGTYKALSMEEYSRLRKEGKIKTGSVDVLIEGGQDATSTRPGDAASVSSSDSKALSYQNFKAKLAAGRVEGVVFKGPRGMSAFALVDDQAVAVSFDAEWKRQEAATLCDNVGIPNNLREVLAAGR